MEPYSAKCFLKGKEKRKMLVMWDKKTWRIKLRETREKLRGKRMKLRKTL
jgi:transcription initiation factor IIE alpha subunit